MKSLVIAEKPSVAKDFADVLGCERNSKNCYENDKYIITWALGHLITLAEPADYSSKYKSWDLETLPILPDRFKLKVIPKTWKQFNLISSLIKRDDVNVIIIATDAGREGELVARWIITLGGGNKKELKRLWISSQTKKAVEKGFASLEPASKYSSLYKAAEARARADWLIGLNVSRALSCKYNNSLNAGRVQTPVLGMIWEREEEILNFKPTPYYYVDIEFDGFKARWRNSKGNSRIDYKEFALSLCSSLRGQRAIVVKVHEDKRKVPPPSLFDLTELQRVANEKFSFSAKKTLNIAQSLYERHKLLSYPRTNSRHITTDIADELKERIKSISFGEFQSYANKLLKEGLNLGKHIVDNGKISDHYAIIPTETVYKGIKLTGDEEKIYKLVFKRFLTSLSQNCIVEQKNIFLLIKSDNFVAKGSKIISKGWQEVENTELINDESKQVLPSLTKGSSIMCKNLCLISKLTQPPDNYKESTLLTAMENPCKFIKDKDLKKIISKGGLGTPATRAEIIEKLIRANYIERYDKELLITKKGKELLNLAPNELKQAALTAKWETRLRLIEEGVENSHMFEADIKEKAKEMVSLIKASSKNFTAFNKSSQSCPKCSSQLNYIDKKAGRAYSCSSNSCDYKQFKKGKFKKSKEEFMINNYADNSTRGSGVTIGNLFENVLEKKRH